MDRDRTSFSVVNRKLGSRYLCRFQDRVPRFCHQRYWCLAGRIGEAMTRDQLGLF